MFILRTYSSKILCRAHVFPWYAHSMTFRRKCVKKYIWCFLVDIFHIKLVRLRSNCNVTLLQNICFSMLAKSIHRRTVTQSTSARYLFFVARLTMFSLGLNIILDLQFSLLHIYSFIWLFMFCVIVLCTPRRFLNAAGWNVTYH